MSGARPITLMLKVKVRFRGQRSKIGNLCLGQVVTISVVQLYFIITRPFTGKRRRLNCVLTNKKLDKFYYWACSLLLYIVYKKIF